MFTKWKYKIWKHLTKELVSDSLIKKSAFTHMCVKMNGMGVIKPVSIAPASKLVNLPTVDIPRSQGSSEVICDTKLPKLVAVQGIYYSGSSAVIGFLNEFDNIRVVGFPDDVWSKAKSKESGSECCFFYTSGFYELVQSFHSSVPEDQDYRIKTFITKVNHVYRHKRGFIGHENLPQLYGSYFKEITQKFLLRVLDLDDFTREFMADKEFPYVTQENEDNTYERCNFHKGSGKRQYFFYQFAKISEKEFHAAVAEYINSFFSILGGNEFVAYDQLLRYKGLEFVNTYLSNPAKQIIIVRDPRDQFMSSFRRESLWLMRNIGEFKAYIQSRYREFPQSVPNRMYVRFEDLVLRYDETTRKIMDFIGLQPKNHVAPKAMFDPMLSVANIGGWRHYHRQEFMQEIEKELKEYCFYPEFENLSDEARLLLKSSGNWDDVLM